MPTLVEYQIPLPLALEEYKVAQLYAVARESEAQTDATSGVEIVKNEPFTDDKAGLKGQYTFKIYHFGDKLPGWIRKLLPEKVKSVNEEAWNAYPYCKTILTSPYSKKFEIKIITVHAPYDPAAGFQKNAHKLDEKTLKKRKVEIINIATDKVEDKTCPDPATFKSTKTGRGPITGPAWQDTFKPVMVAYKLCEMKCDVAIVGGKVESYIAGYERNLFTTFHRKLVCWMDNWYGMTVDDVRRMEDETRARNRKRLEAVAAGDQAGAPVQAIDDTEADAVGSSAADPSAPP